MLCCQGLVRLACVETVFPKTIGNGLLTVKVFPKYIYVKTVDSLINNCLYYVKYLLW